MEIPSERPLLILSLINAAINVNKAILALREYNFILLR
jgi:hypothetical protein